MKKNQSFSFLCLFVVTILSGCATTMRMENVNNPATFAQAKESEKLEMLIRPHQTLGLEPTLAVRKGDISTFLVVFSKRLLGGEYFLGTLRWNIWVVKTDGTESFGQVLFSGIHPSGDFFGTAVLDGQVSSGQMAILSTDMNFIYSPFEKELPIEREKFLTDPKYRRQMIQEANKSADGKDFNINSLTAVPNFQATIKIWNQIRFPEGYLLSPYGVEEVALIRGQNPQYDYFEKLIGTGRFAIRIGLDPVGMAIANAAGIAMDLIRASSAPSRGRDFSSVVERREQSFANEYLLALTTEEMKKRNAVNAKLLNLLKGEVRK